MKKNQLIILLILVILILAVIVVWIFSQKQEAVFLLEAVRPGAEEDFYSYLELPSRSGKFLGFDENTLELTVLYFDTETMKTAVQPFKIDKETILSISLFEPYEPNLFPLKTLQEVKQETQTTVSYLSAENEMPTARLIRVKASF